MITPEDFLRLIQTDNKDIFRLGIINKVVGNKSYIVFDGEEEQSKKAYMSVNYTPKKDDRVLVIRVKGTYLILGDIKK